MTLAGVPTAEESLLLAAHCGDVEKLRVPDLARQKISDCAACMQPMREGASGEAWV
jgi:hypothetical protein